MSNNTTFQCYGDLSQEQYKFTQLIDGIMRIIQVVGCGLTLVLLLLILKKRAFDSPAKRFGLPLIFAFSLSALNRVIMEFYQHSLPLWLCIVTIVLFCLGSTIILYLVALPVALLVQISAPLFPEWFKHNLSNKIPFIESALQITILLLSVLFNASQFVNRDKFFNFCKRCITLYDYEVFALSFSVAALFGTIITLGVLYYKFRHTVTITKRTKWLLLKVCVLFFAIDGAFIGDAIVAASIKNYTIQLSISQSIFFTVVKLVFVLALILLMYNPSTDCRWCCNHTLRTARARTPLIPQSEKHFTNPDSVWDHANVPSYTQTYHPPEMSDCVTTVTA